MIVALQGGLANTLFQWAFGISVAKARNDEVKFSRSRVDQDRKRNYCLDSLGLLNGLDLEFENNEYNPYFDSGLYDPGVYSAPGDTTFVGYWQTEKYFDVNLIRGKLGCKKISAMHWARKIVTDLDSVALHVRRGDYVSEPHTQKFHGNLSMEYYNTGIELIRQKYPNAKFFIFSDDTQWCKENFSEHTVVDGTNHIDDLWLMSLCQHAIIANSAFSWWGAWLGDEKPERIVIAPEKWFNNPDQPSRDIVPERWIKL